MAALPSLRQLSYLVMLAETLHFTEAARRCFVTQSTLSGGIMELERVLGGMLVERDRQNVRLTPLGEQVLSRAKVLLADTQDLMRLSREMSEPLTGDLHLGIIPTIAPFVLTPLLQQVAIKLPKVHIHLYEVQSAKAIEQLEHGTLDMVFLALPFDTQHLKVQEILTEQLFVICHTEDKACQKVKTVNGLDLERLILLEEGHCLRNHALSACSTYDKKGKTRLQASSLPTLLEMISAGLGYTFLPALAIQHLLLSNHNDLVVHPIKHAPRRTLALVTRKNIPLQAEFEMLVSILQQICQ